jgi:hypothetical protein
VAAKEIRADAIQFRDAPAASLTRTEEIGPPTAESALHPYDWRGLFDISPFVAVLLDTIRQNEAITVSSELDGCNVLTVARPFSRASIPGPQAALPLSRLMSRGLLSSTVSLVLVKAQRVEPKPDPHTDSQRKVVSLVRSEAVRDRTKKAIVTASNVKIFETTRS